MGVFSKVHRYREAGEGANYNNMMEYGVPVRSLFTTTKFFSLHHHIDVTDESENIIYQANSKVISLHDKTIVTDMRGNEVAYISRKFFTIHQRHYIDMPGNVHFELSTELLHLIKDVTNIEGLGWQLRGNILELNFALFDTDGSVIAVISQKLFSLHDKYCIDIYKPEYEGACVAILIAVQHMIRDREAARAASSSSSSSSD